MAGCRILGIRIFIKANQFISVDMVKEIGARNTVVDSSRSCRILIQMQRYIGLEITKQDLRRVILGVQIVFSINVRSAGSAQCRKASGISSPAGAATETVSPARWLCRARPTGESSEMRPSLGLASWEPTIS